MPAVYCDRRNEEFNALIQGRRSLGGFPAEPSEANGRIQSAALFPVQARAEYRNRGNGRLARRAAVTSLAMSAGSLDRVSYQRGLIHA